MFAEDLSVFFNAAEFGSAAVLEPGGPGVVLYDENGAVLATMGLQTVGPSALCPAALWPAASEGQTLTVQTPLGPRGFIVRSVMRLDDGALVLLALATL